jgi:amino acid permease
MEADCRQLQPHPQPQPQLQRPYKANKYQLLCLGLLAALTGIYSTWNQTLSAGLGYELIVHAILSIAYICYCSCASELTSTFPFPGGSYAMARCTIGWYAGYMVGCCEIFYYILSFAYTNAGFVYLVTAYVPSLTSYRLVVLLALIAAQISICISRRVLWYAITILAVYMCIFNFSYIFGSIGQIDFNEYAYSRVSASSLRHIDDDKAAILRLSLDDDAVPAGEKADAPMTLFVSTAVVSTLIRILPKCYWTYLGSEYVNLACEDCEHPRTQIPFAQVTGIVIIVIHNICACLCAASTYPGADRVSGLLMPLSPGKL